MTPKVKCFHCKSILLSAVKTEKWACRVFHPSSQHLYVYIQQKCERGELVATRADR